MGLELSTMDRAIARQRKKYERMLAKLRAKAERRRADALADYLFAADALNVVPHGELDVAKQVMVGFRKLADAADELVALFERELG